MIVALVADLIFSTRIGSTARALGVELRVARSIERLEALGAEGGVELVIVDLALEDEDPIEAIRRCRAIVPPPRVLAFVSHVRADLVEAARAAGADEVLARSAFTARLPELLGAAG